MATEWNEGDNTQLAEDVTAEVLSAERESSYVVDAVTNNLTRSTITEFVQLVLDVLETTMGYDFTDYESDDDDDDEDDGDWTGDDDESEQWNDNDDDAAGQRYD